MAYVEKDILSLGVFLKMCKENSKMFDVCFMGVGTRNFNICIVKTSYPTASFNRNFLF